MNALNWVTTLQDCEDAISDPRFTPDQLARHVLESLLEGCQVIGANYEYLYLNDAAIQHARLPREQLIGRRMNECYPGIDQTSMFSRLQRCMTERVHLQMDNEFTYPDGTKGWFELRFVPVPEGVCVLSIDITERKQSEADLARSEAQLRHAQKMEAVGRLAGGVAHDFNNVLSAILSYTALLLTDLRQSDPVRAQIQEIQTAGERAARLTRQLLALGRQQAMEPRKLDLNQLISDMEKMLVQLIGADVELTLLLSPAPGLVKADAGSIEQVLLNLVVNARDAMPSGGRLTIETANVELEEGYAQSHIGVRPGPHVMVAVTDTGIGMDASRQARVFEPFYTTKDASKGTGLGLSTVYGIVKQIGGHIRLFSEPGRGTTFKIYLPRQQGVAGTEPAALPEPTSNRGDETILLVEDDDQVRTVTRNILHRSGYRVLDASNGGEALLVCEQHTTSIDLLLVDLVLPKLNGRQLAERLLGLRRPMKVLFMSGYADDAVRHGFLESAVAYLQKPITPEMLTRKVRQVLDAPVRKP